MTIMADNWMTTSETAVALGVSVRTIQHRLANREYQTKTEGSKKYILLPDGGNNAPDYDTSTNAINQPLADWHPDFAQTMPVLGSDLVQRKTAPILSLSPIKRVTLVPIMR